MNDRPFLQIVYSDHYYSLIIYLFDKEGQELEKEGGFDDHDAAVP